MQHWAANRETMLHAKLAGVKAGLGLRADQEPHWSAFESAVNGAFKSRREAMEKTMKARERGERMSLVDRMEDTAGRMSQNASDLKRVSETARPLYDSFDDTQKGNFELFGREMAVSEPRPPSDRPSAEWDFRGGNAGYSWEPYGWAE